MASGALQAADTHDAANETAAFGLLGIYSLLAGGLLGLRLRAEYRGENLGEAPIPTKTRERERSWLGLGGGPIAAEIEKEFRTLSRSMTQLYAICVPPIMVVVVSSLFRNGGLISHQPVRLALPVGVAYGLLGFTQLIYNCLGTEGKGIQLLFLFPVPVRTILLAKNLFHSALYLIAAMVSGTLTSWRLGHPDRGVLAITFAWLAFALPANLAAGNMLSIAMPYRVNLGRIGRQAGSQANALLSMLIQMGILGIGAGVMSLCALLDRMWMATPALLVLALVAVAVWLLVLRNADAIVNRRRNTLIPKLAKD